MSGARRVSVPDVVAYARAAALFARRGVEYSGRPKVFGSRPQLTVDGSMAVGRRFQLRGVQFPVQISVAGGGSLRIGDDVWVNQGVNVFAADSVTIGSRVLLADLASVSDSNFHEVAPGEGVRVEPVTIEDDVWVGRGAFVLPGVTIGRHAVVAAGAVVTRSVPPRSVVAGNPAAVVRAFDCPDDFSRVSPAR